MLRPSENCTRSVLDRHRSVTREVLENGQRDPGGDQNRGYPRSTPRHLRTQEVLLSPNFTGSSVGRMRSGSQAASRRSSSSPSVASPRRWARRRCWCGPCRLFSAFSKPLPMRRSPASFPTSPVGLRSMVRRPGCVTRSSSRRFRSGATGSPGPRCSPSAAASPPATS